VPQKASKYYARLTLVQKREKGRMCSGPRKFTFKEVEFPKQNSSEFVANAYSKDGSSDQEWRSESVNQDLHRGSSIGTYGYKLPACSVVSRRYRSWCAAYCSSDERLSMPAGNPARAPRNDLSRSQDRSGCYARPGALYVAWNLKRCNDALKNSEIIARPSLQHG